LLSGRFAAVERRKHGQRLETFEFGMIGEFVDPRQVDQEQPTRIISRGIEAIEKHWLASVIRAKLLQTRRPIAP
jgi:hypothetical protein